MDAAERLLTWFGKKARQPTQKAPPEKPEASPLGLPKHYLLLNEIGSGGMGVLYKAIDTRLHRPVVVKSVRDSLLVDPEVVDRFRKEALASAAIDHPYVCKIYELLEIEHRTLIVMEFVEGETLEQVLARGPLGLTDTVRFGAEISEALGAAHAKGLIHRDIKPSNIMITPHRHVKVIDFGLAKALRDGGEEPGAGGPGPARDGGFVGTLCYMSPEQASGQPVDQRSDVFSIGILLFQCLTGHLPFSGDTSREYIQNLLLEEPPLLRTLLPSAPGELEQLMSRCLAKEPAERYESAEALAGGLAQVADILSSGQLQPIELPARRPSRRSRLVAAAAVLAALGLGTAGVLWGVWQAGGPGLLDVRAFKQEAVATWPSEELESRISPDNKWTSFISNRGGFVDLNLWLQGAGGAEPFPITSLKGRITSSLWSPDGSEIAYLHAQEEGTTLQIIPALGGAPRLSVPLKLPSPMLVRWLGDRIYLLSRNSLQRLDVKTHGLEEVFRSPPELSLHSLDVRPDGQKLVFSASIQKQPDLWIADLDGSRLDRLTEDPFDERYPKWLDSEGRAVIYSSNKSSEIHLWRMVLADRSAQQLTFGANTKDRVEDVSRDGSFLTYQRIEEAANLYRLDPQSASEVPLTADTLQDFWSTAARATETVAFQRTRPSYEMGYFLAETRIFLASGDPPDFQFARLQVEDGYAPLLSPDGRWLAYLRTPSKAATQPALAFLPDLWLQDLQSQRARPIGQRFELGSYYPFPLERLARNLVWSPDSRALVSVHRKPEGFEIRRFRPQADSMDPEVLASTSRRSEELRDPALSPDGGAVAYGFRSADDSGVLVQVHVKDLATGADRLVLEERLGEADDLYCRGWPDASSVLVLRSRPNPDRLTERVEVLRIETASGDVRLLGQFDGAYGGTARLDPAMQALYITGVEERAHNLYVLSIESSTWRRLTQNQFPGVTYCGIEITQQGAILYSRQKWNKDIWKLRFHD
jgi:serine/threonine protein kinase